MAADRGPPRRLVPRLRSVEGGDSRSRSVRNGLAALESCAMPTDWVLVHDAARPCLAEEDLERLLTSVQSDPLGGLLATPAADTLKRSSGGPPAEAAGVVAVAQTVDRSALWRALTPQMFRYGRLCTALDAAHAAGRFPTDEAEALEWQGAHPRLICGAAGNLKITTPDDLVLAGAILRARRGPKGQSTQMQRTQMESTPMRIGSGFDVHAFGPGEFVMLGGIRIAHSRGVIAHSDGDVVLHALCDALLGAAGLGDIGQHFPDSDARWRGADSGRFVSEVLGKLRERGLEVANADVTVLAQAPRVGPHREAMRARIAALLAISPERVNIKATTTEGLGFLGRAEGIAAQATVLLAESAPWRPPS